MKAISLLLIAGLLCATACEECDHELPACVTNLITTEPQPLEIWRYRFDNKIVYYLVGDCCDQYNSVYDLNCNLLCHPSGGIAGSGDGRCPGFHNTAQQGELLWKKK